MPKKKTNSRLHIASRQRQPTQKTSSATKKAGLKTVSSNQSLPSHSSGKLKAKSELTAQVVSFNGKTSRISLPAEIFKVEIKPATLAQAVRVYLSNQKKGTAKTKTRGEVSGGGKKPWRQKGTGRARQGSIRAPHWRGGGVVFGPKPAGFKLKLPKKVRKKALFGVLSYKLAKNEIKIVDGFEKIEPKTHKFLKTTEKLKIPTRNTLWVVNSNSRNLILAGRNLPSLKFCRVENLTAYEILSADNLIFSKAAIEKLKERLK